MNKIEKVSDNENGKSFTYYSAGKRILSRPREKKRKENKFTCSLRGTLSLYYNHKLSKIRGLKK